MQLQASLHMIIPARLMIREIKPSQKDQKDLGLEALSPYCGHNR